MKLHIGNIATTVTDAELKAVVAQYGEPLSLEIVRDRTGVSKGFGFAEFADAEQAKAAIAGLDGKDIAGQAVKVGEARPRKTDAPRPRPQG
jgi:cold-inducible RNA-binding protein